MKPCLFLACFVMLLVCKVSAQKITHVVLSAPTNAHHFGESYNLVSLKNVDKASTDTIKIIEMISSYKMIDSVARIDIGGVNPSQKLTIILKNEAKQYFDAMLEIEYRGGNLQGMKIIAIGNITFFKGKPQIIITNPNLFTIIKN